MPTVSSRLLEWCWRWDLRRHDADVEIACPAIASEKRALGVASFERPLLLADVGRDPLVGQRPVSAREVASCIGSAPLVVGLYVVLSTRGIDNVPTGVTVTMIASLVVGACCLISRLGRR